jgi:glycosyltransferase involved in cell wall biosynthesis
MKISLYTIARDCIYFDFHFEAMLRHHLPFADEIVVNEGFSSDETYERIRNIDPKIKIFRERWDVGDAAGSLYTLAKNQARERCTGEWCILLDSDEFIPEWEFARIRALLAETTQPVVAMRYLHFYGNYKVFYTKPERKLWPVFKYPVHRNLPEMRVWGDGSNVELLGAGRKVDTSVSIECHHMGFVRWPARLRHKWKVQAKLNLEKPTKDRTPGFVFDLAPHNWFDQEYVDDLEIYEGPYIKAVVDDPAEFVRDDMKLFEHLRAQAQVGSSR